MRAVREWFALTGKGARKICAVFATDAEEARRAAAHLRAGAPELPLFVFCVEPLEEPVAGCDFLRSGLDAADLAFAALDDLWPEWVAISVVAWTGSPGAWALKLAPFLVPPFRVLVMNESGDFFDATPREVLGHALRRVRELTGAAGNRLRDITRGWALWALSELAGWFLPLIRRFYAGLASAPSAPCVAGPAAGEGMASIEIRYRQWPSARIEKLLAATNARWIEFREDGAVGGLEDALPLFDGGSTFAVSRQVTSRRWKPGLFATAPFRELMRGEAARVFAPIGPVTIVDCEKLRALGVPRSLTPGAAWMELFVRAHAAGWVSYSCGTGAPAPEAPDQPLEEAEFTLRAWLRPELRVRRGGWGGEWRGAIARSVAVPEASAAPLRVFLVSPYVPYPLSHGGAVRIWNLSRALRDRVEFHLACFREKDDQVDYRELSRVFASVSVLDRDEPTARDRSRPLQVRDHDSEALRALLEAAQRRGAIDLLQIEYAHLAEFREAAPRVPAILVEHDLTYTLYEQLGDRDEAARWRRFESYWLDCYDAVWTMSGQDRQKAIALGSHAESTYEIANGVDLERFAAMPDPEPLGELLYVGSFRHLPNLLGFERLRKEVLPEVRKRHPNVRLTVVAGPDPAKYWREFLGTPYPERFEEGVTVLPFVEDLRPLYERAAAVLAPLLVSAGTNIKIMEAMACARPIVATPVAVTGLPVRDGEDLIIRESFHDFAGAVSHLLSDGAARRAMGAAARLTAENHFGWNRIADSAYASYQQIRKRTNP